MFMVDHPKVSIVIPVHNGANYLAQAIDSALGQTYTNVEVLVVNDGSTDGGRTEAIAKGYGDRIVYISQENMGVGGAMNTGVAHMTGDVFTWLSHDDIHLPHKVAAQIGYHRRLGNRDAILFSDYFLINGEGETIYETKLSLDRYVEAPMLPLLNGAINGCTLFIPSRIVREAGPFDERLRFVQDYELWNKILAKYEFFLQPQPLIQYRIHPSQDTNKPQAIPEGNALWLRINDARSEIERVHMFGSSQKYYQSISQFLAQTPYVEASARIGSHLEGLRDRTFVSVVLPTGDRIDVLRRSVESVLRQSHERLELILVEDGSIGDITQLSALAERDGRIRLIRRFRHSGTEALRRGILAVVGDYAAFLLAGAEFSPEKIGYQLDAMQATGSRFSYTGIGTPETTAPGSDTDGQGGAAVELSTVMLHRSLISAGYDLSSSTERGSETVWEEIAKLHPPLVLAQPMTLTRKD